MRGQETEGVWAANGTRGGMFALFLAALSGVTDSGRNLRGYSPESSQTRSEKA